MKINEIRSKAKAMGLKADGGKSVLIPRIQQAEGNEICFGKRKVCPQMKCCWREDCLPKA